MIAMLTAALFAWVSAGMVPVAASSALVPPPNDPPAIPERFRLPAEPYSVTVRLKYELIESGVDVLEVTFPSAVQTAHAVNNTVHAELFRPRRPGARPTAVVLDILDGKGVVSRGEALWLAQHGIAALALTMPYYGARRPANVPIRMMSTDVAQSVENARQAVLDCRRAANWLATLPTTDPTRLAIVGTSLGSFIGGVAAAVEPKFTRAALLLGGGGLVDAFYDHPKARGLVSLLRYVGVTKESLRPIIAPADPITYAPLLRQKQLLLIAASQDEVVPPAAMRTLWEATGQPQLIWYDATHVGAAIYAFPVMENVITFLKR
jgi:dienelactone hydrolase